MERVGLPLSHDAIGHAQAYVAKWMRGARNRARRFDSAAWKYAEPVMRAFVERGDETFIHPDWRNEFRDLLRRMDAGKYELVDSGRPDPRQVFQPEAERVVNWYDVGTDWKPKDSRVSDKKHDKYRVTHRYPPDWRMDGGRPMLKTKKRPAKRVATKIEPVRTETKLESVLRYHLVHAKESMFSLSKRSGVPRPVISRFLSRQRTMTLESAGRLFEALGLKLRSR
jgi:hypothetical protein